jgi:hypothetical protein
MCAQCTLDKRRKYESEMTAIEAELNAARVSADDRLKCERILSCNAADHDAIVTVYAPLAFEMARNAVRYLLNAEACDQFKHFDQFFGSHEPHLVQ